MFPENGQFAGFTIFKNLSIREELPRLRKWRAPLGAGLFLWFCGEEVVGRYIETQDGKHAKTLFIGIGLSPGLAAGTIAFSCIG